MEQAILTIHFIPRLVVFEFAESCPKDVSFLAGDRSRFARRKTQTPRHRCCGHAIPEDARRSVSSGWTGGGAGSKDRLARGNSSMQYIIRVRIEPSTQE